MAERIVSYDGRELSPYSEEYKSGEEIMAEAKRLEQVKSDAKYIAREIIKELDKREAEKESTETVPVETVAMVEIPAPEPTDYTLPMASAACGFLIGVLLTSLCFIIKLNRIRRESERW